MIAAKSSLSEGRGCSLSPGPASDLETKLLIQEDAPGAKSAETIMVYD